LARLKEQAEDKRRAEERAKSYNKYVSTPEQAELPDAKKVEQITKNNRNITKIIVRKQGITTVYRKVEHGWGAIYYFREMENITKLIFDLETADL
jgi:hypothetical protein